MKHLSVLRKPFLLLFVAALSLLVGWGVGKVLTLKRPDSYSRSLEDKIKMEEGREGEKEKERKEEEKLPKEWESYTGIISSLDSSIYSEGSHQLTNENGDTVLLLEAEDDKLMVSLGMEAEVQGPVRMTADGNQKIMMVEESSLGSR